MWNIPHQFQLMILHFPNENDDSSDLVHPGQFVEAGKKEKN